MSASGVGLRPRSSQENPKLRTGPAERPARYPRVTLNAVCSRNPQLRTTSRRASQPRMSESRSPTGWDTSCSRSSKRARSSKTSFGGQWLGGTSLVKGPAHRPLLDLREGLRRHCKAPANCVLVRRRTRDHGLELFAGEHGLDRCLYSFRRWLVAGVQPSEEADEHCLGERGVDLSAAAPERGLARTSGAFSSVTAVAKRLSTSARGNCSSVRNCATKSFRYFLSGRLYAPGDTYKATTRRTSS